MNFKNKAEEVVQQFSVDPQTTMETAIAEAVGLIARTLKESYDEGVIAESSRIIGFD